MDARLLTRTEHGSNNIALINMSPVKIVYKNVDFQWPYIG